MAEQQEGEADRRNELARIRTEAARRRTQLANERSFSAWVRTGLTLLVAGFAATRLLDEAGPSWLVTLAGVLSVGLGTLTFLVAWRSYRSAAAGDAPGLPAGLIGLITTVLIILSALGLFLILDARPGP